MPTRTTIEGIELAYRVAREQYDRAGINRVILATDGDFNVGVSSEGELERLIEKERASGVYLTVLGFGMGNYKDSTLELLADRGNGNYAYVDSLREARKVLIDQGGSTLFTVAEDVKLQLQFNPAEVASYRLIGYENRLLRDKDFADDRKDAGEVGAGHSVTALYEIVPTRHDGEHGDLATLQIRYKAPHGKDSRLLAFPIAGTAAPVDATSSDFRFAAAVAGFGMLLKHSPYRAAMTFGLVRELAAGAQGADAQGYRREFLSLLASAEQINAGEQTEIAR